jgi:hypothetical protein
MPSLASSRLTAASFRLSRAELRQDFLVLCFVRYASPRLLFPHIWVQHGNAGPGKGVVWCDADVVGPRCALSDTALRWSDKVGILCWLARFSGTKEGRKERSCGWLCSKLGTSRGALVLNRCGHTVVRLPGRRHWLVDLCRLPCIDWCGISNEGGWAG